MTKRKGFTLVESLAVIAIIGILATLATTIALGAQRSSRDAKRKNDLYAISQGFDARALDRTCNNSNVIGQYPRSPDAVNRWVRVSLIGNSQNPCAPFPEYLKTTPTDPQSPTFDYYYNLTPDYRHYRLAAGLERINASLDECKQASAIWESSPLDGKAYDCVSAGAISGNRTYQHHIGK